MKFSTLAFLSITAFAASSQATTCHIVGRDPQNPNNYTQLIKTSADLVFKSEGQILHVVDNVVISYSLGSGDSLSVATSSASEPKLFAMASGAKDFVQLTDGANGISVYCK